jgi:polysaccharide export outer membrane protein
MTINQLQLLHSACGLAFLCLPALCQVAGSIPSAIAGANLPSQPLGPNDLIAISVYDAPEFTRTVRISTDGQIRLPMLNRALKAAGLLPGELETSIADALNAEGILVNPVVTVTVAEYQSRPISVVGAVKSPITFQASGTVTLLEAISRAGGFSPDAGLQVLITRVEQGAAARSTRRISVRSLIDDADGAANIRLIGGEEIRIPEVGKVVVLGNVRKPGSYPMRDSVETTVLKMLAVAEGLAPYASKQAYIIRSAGDTGPKREIPVELSKILKRQAPDVPLEANDILYVPDNSGRRASMTVLEKLAGFGAATASGVIIWGGR